jgi:hypothetical protein
MKLDGMVQVRKNAGSAGSAERTEYERHPKRAHRIMQQRLAFRQLSGCFMRIGVTAQHQAGSRGGSYPNKFVAITQTVFMRSVCAFVLAW